MVVQSPNINFFHTAPSAVPHATAHKLLTHGVDREVEETAVLQFFDDDAMLQVGRFCDGSVLLLFIILCKQSFWWQ